MPRVSVVVPAYNAADFITDAYRSVVEQTIDDWEMIIVDDGSQDDTLGVIRSLAAADKRINVVDLPSNLGPAYARNAALAIAQGDWIALLDADDRYGPERLEVLTSAGERTGADIVLDNQFVVDPISRQLAFLAFEPPTDEVTGLRFSDFLRSTQSNTVFDFGYLKPMIKRCWLAASGIKYREELRLGEDLMFLFDCYANHANVALLSTPYYYYRFQYSQSNRAMSPTTRTEVRYEPLVVAAERFFEEHRWKQSRLENCLVASACEALREIVIVAAFQESLRQHDAIRLARCLRHPLRLFKGVYFERRRSLLLRRRANARRRRASSVGPNSGG